MEISKEELLRINKGFGGDLRSRSSLDYAFEKIENKKLGMYKKIAYLLRAILVDPPFSDGNKRTAAYACLSFVSASGKNVDRELLMHHIVSIAKQNIHNLKNIGWRLKNAIK